MRREHLITSSPKIFQVAMVDHELLQHLAGERLGLAVSSGVFWSELRIEPAMDPLALTNVYVKQRHDLLFFWHFPEKFNVILMAPRRKVHESFFFQMHRLGFHESMQVQAFVKHANF